MRVKLTKEMDKQQAVVILEKVKRKKKNNIKSFFGKGKIKGDIVKIQQKMREDEWDN
jgi:hypothetical protein